MKVTSVFAFSESGSFYQQACNLLADNIERKINEMRHVHGTIDIESVSISASSNFPNTWANAILVISFDYNEDQGSTT